MEGANNLNQLLLGNNADVIQNLNDHEENNHNCNSFLYQSTFFIIFVYFLYIQIDSLYNSINYFTNEINTTPDIIFEKCKKYPSLKDIYFSIFTILFVTFVLISVLIINIQNNEIVERLSSILLSFFLYLLGPLSTGLGILGLLYFNKICFICSDNDPTNMRFDYTTFLYLLTLIFIGLLFLYGSCGLKSNYLLMDSIRFKEEGNYFLGKLFWKCTYFCRRPENNEINN